VLPLHLVAACNECDLPRGIRGRPTVHAGIVPSACVHEKWRERDRPTPYNHFAAGPHCGVKVSGLRGVIGASWCPDIYTRIISPTGVHPDLDHMISTPDDHLGAGPDCRMIKCTNGRISRGWCPAIGARIVYPAGV
jgi:hypothetical protein